MARETCLIPSCDRETGADDSTSPYRDGKFCSPKHELKYEHIKADARDARRAEEERNAVDKNDLPEYDGPPY